jgi:hypothetical protein
MGPVGWGGYYGVNCSEWTRAEKGANDWDKGGYGSKEMRLG